MTGCRLLGNGELKAKVAFSVWGASKSAVAAVEKAGGSVTILAPAKEASKSPPDPHIAAGRADFGETGHGLGSRTTGGKPQLRRALPRPRS